MKKQSLYISILVVLSCLVHTSVHGQAVNDEVATAIEITSFPHHDPLVNFSAADTEGPVPASDGPCYHYEPMVWYKFRTTEAGDYGIYNEDFNYLMVVFYWAIDLNATSINDLVPISSCYGSVNGVGTYLDADTDYYIVVAGAFDMPVEFVNFSALPVTISRWEAHQENDKIRLDWSTTSETNHQDFIIEKLEQSTWQSIGIVGGQGTSTANNSYFLYDHYPVSGSNYYRLKMIDYDGAFSYSEISEGQFKQAEIPVFIYPNPYSDHFQLSVVQQNEPILRMQIWSMDGKVLYTVDHPAISAPFNFSHLTRGSYLLQLQTEKETYSKILIKAR